MIAAPQLPWWRRVGPGLVLAGAVAGLGFVIRERWAEVSPLVVGVAVGALLTNVGLIPVAARDGLQFASKKLLRIGIVLLGLRLSVKDAIHLGWPTGLVIVVVVVITFFGTQAIGRRLGLSPGLSLLVATGYSICGASAIAAMVPFADAEEEDVAYSLALVTLCGSLSIVVLPLIGHGLGFEAARFGRWVGGAVHDVGQTVATASAYGGGEKATVARTTAIVVKLTRVVMLAPIVGLTSVRHRRRIAAENAGAAVSSGLVTAKADPVKLPPIIPAFVLGFLAMIAGRATGWLSTDVLRTSRTVETWMLAMALVGLGAGVHVAKLRKVGGRPLLLGLIAWVLVAGISLIGTSLVRL